MHHPANDLSRAENQALPLEVHALSKAFAGKYALAGLDLSVEEGEVHALLGENGSGKSTFIKLLSGYHRPDEGSAFVAGVKVAGDGAEAAANAGCRFIHQDLGLIENLTVLDNMFLTTGFPSRFGTVLGRQARAQATKDLAMVGLRLDLDQMASSLSPAQRTGLALARALRPSEAHPTRLLVLDEPTATLPSTEVEQLLTIVRTIASSGVGVLYVTHRLEEVPKIADKVSVLRDGRLVGTHPARNLTRSEIIELLVGAGFHDVTAPPSRLTSSETALLQVRHLTAKSIRGVSFDVMPGEIVGVAGITGSGRESLLGVVFGAVGRAKRGGVSLEGRAIPAVRPDSSVAAGLAFIPSDRRNLGAIMDLCARENVSISDPRRFGRFGQVSRRSESKETARWFEQLNVRPAGSGEAKFSSYSGGNQQKILFAKWLRMSPKVFLLDEPTQGVDIKSKLMLHEELVQIATAGVGVVVASSDVEELTALCSRVLVLKDGRVADELVGSRISAAAISRAVLSQSEGSAA